MNDNLKFSWGHIIAFVALIVIGYFSFVGFTYLSQGNFLYSGIGCALTLLVYMFMFLSVQQLKSAAHKMNRKIWWERILLFLTPFVFVAGYISISHFWTIRTQDEAIVRTFNKSIVDGKLLFNDYEEYATERIANYDKLLTHIVAAKTSDPKTFHAAGFKEGKEIVQKNNMVEALKLQLMSDNYSTLKTKALEWIEKSRTGATTWNVFLLGNTREISSALQNWENQLKSFSDKEMSNEKLGGEVPKFSSTGAQTAVKGITSLASSYTRMKSPTAVAIVVGVVLYLMLLFPYFLQERHTRSPYTGLFRKRKGLDSITVDMNGNGDSSSATEAGDSGVFRL